MNAHGASVESFGAFDLLEQLGCGGTATVYKARNRNNGQVVALKIGAGLLALEPVSLQRFKREFTVMRRLRHPSLVRVLEFGELDQVPYLVLELVTGLSLDKVLQQSGPLPLSQAVKVFSQVAHGLRFLHRNQILHRDVKPGNIFLTKSGNAKLGDFGLLKEVASESSITVARQGIGTLEYGAPEQFEDAKNTDCRCDLYSLAATLYSALTGLFPFGVGSQMRVLQRKLLDQLVPLHYLVPTIPVEVDDLISRSMQAAREQRPASIEEFIAILSAVKPGLSSSPVPAAPVPVVPKRSGAAVDRRRSARISVTLPVAYVPFHQHQRGTLKATILDVSSGGLCLKTNAPLPVSTLLEITVPSKGASCLAQIRWVKTTGDQECILGCSFARAQTREWVDTLELSQKQANRRVASRRPAKGKPKVLCYKGSSYVGPNLALAVLDLSETGLRILTNTPLDKGQEVLVILEGQEGMRPMKCTGQVVWAVRTEAGAYVTGIRLNKHLTYRDFSHLT